MRGKWIVMVVGVAMASLSAAGCADQEKVKAIQDRDALASRNKNLEDQIAKDAQAQSALQNELDSKNSQLTQKDMELQGLRDRLGKEPNRAPVAEGWVSGAFGDMVTVGADLLFDPGKAELKPGGKAALDKIVRDIDTHYAGKVLRVYGYTDADPIVKSDWDDNLELSGNRAMAVTRYLTSKGISAKLIETVAMGKEHPLGADKAKNRRVEIFAVRAK